MTLRISLISLAALLLLTTMASLSVAGSPMGIPVEATANPR